MSIVNLAAYKFVSLDDLPTLRARALERAETLALKGTVLLAPEGINLFLAGPRAAVDAFMAWLRGDARFADLVPKESLSDVAPFGRLRVRLKKEIITLRAPAIRPEAGRAPAVDAATLKRWLDQGHDDDGRELLLLDTRNDYETDMGKFPQALDYRLPRFTALPAAVAADRARYEGKTVVSYCTGGIRCEKAALHLRAMGIDNVLQLDGGILKYFEDTGGAHWEGGCFVFDDRGAVGHDLLPLPATPQRPLPAGPQLPLPSGERAGVRGPSCGSTATRHAPTDAPASTRPSSDPSGHPGSSPGSPGQALLPAGEKETSRI